MVCERNDGLPSIVTHSAFTCFQEILTEVEENGEKIEEIIDLLDSSSNEGGDSTTTKTTTTKTTKGI